MDWEGGRGERGEGRGLSKSDTKPSLLETREKKTRGLRLGNSVVCLSVCLLCWLFFATIGIPPPLLSPSLAPGLRRRKTADADADADADDLF